MRVETPEKALELHRPERRAEGVTVFAFDRDQTVDVNPPLDEDREAVPLEWVAYLAHETSHIVYATGNQVLKQEATIPGIAEIVTAHERLEPSRRTAEYTDRPKRRERIRMLYDLFPDADQHVVVDDVDLSNVEEWTHYFSWDFVPAVRSGDLVSELPPGGGAPERVDDYVNPRTTGRFG